MNIVLKKVFQVSHVRDEYNRLGDVVGFYTTEAAAAAAAKGKGFYSGPGDIKPVTAMEGPDGEFYILVRPEPVKLDVDLLTLVADAKKAALAKLTPEERTLLGLGA